MSLNIEILRAINGLSGNPFWDSFFIIIAILGDFWIWTFAAAPFLFFKKRRTSAILWIAASCIAGLLTLALKEIFAVPRPYETYSWVNLVGGSLNDFSFPSGHALRAFACISAVIPAIIQTIKNRRIVIPASTALFFAAALVSFGRMYLGVHYPSDVLAGALIGIALGIGIWKISRKFEKKIHM